RGRGHRVRHVVLAVLAHALGLLDHVLDGGEVRRALGGFSSGARRLECGASLLHLDVLGATDENREESGDTELGDGTEWPGTHYCSSCRLTVCISHSSEGFNPQVSLHPDITRAEFRLKTEGPPGCRDRSGPGYVVLTAGWGAFPGEYRAQRMIS